MSATILGKKVKEVRLAMDLNQIQYAKLLSERSGEDITSRDVAQLENYGRHKKTKNQRPSPAIAQAVEGLAKEIAS